MDVKVKQRLIGALVLGALAVIFVPMIVIGPERKGAADAAEVPIDVPEAPEGDFVTREIPLGPASALPVPDTTATPGVTPPPSDDPNALATVDAAAGAAPRVDALDAAPAVAVDAASGQPVTPVAAAPVPTTTPAPIERTAPATVAAPVPAPAPAPAPPVEPAAVAAGAYTVTAGSFGQRANADALVARLKSSGLPAYTEAAQVNGQPATRVKVGPFADRAGAEAARVRTAAISGSAAVTTGDATPTPAAASPASRPVASSAPTAPAVASGFAVQLGAFASQADAQALIARARAAGFAAFDQRVPTANGVLWRVRLGPVANRAEADRMKSDAAGKLGVSGLVVPHP